MKTNKIYNIMCPECNSLLKIQFWQKIYIDKKEITIFTCDCTECNYSTVLNNNDLEKMDKLVDKS